MSDLTPERRAELRRSMTGTTCGHEDATGELIVPCGQPATGYRWYQDVEHEDALCPSCDEHRNEGGAIIAALLDERDRLAGEVAALRERVKVIEAEALELAIAVAVSNCDFVTASAIRSLIPKGTPTAKERT